MTSFRALGLLCLVALLPTPHDGLSRALPVERFTSGTHCRPSRAQREQDESIVMRMQMQPQAVAPPPDPGSHIETPP